MGRNRCCRLRKRKVAPSTSTKIPIERARKNNASLRRNTIFRVTKGEPPRGAFRGLLVAGMFVIDGEEGLLHDDPHRP